MIYLLGIFNGQLNFEHQLRDTEFTWVFLFCKQGSCQVFVGIFTIICKQNKTRALFRLYISIDGKYLADRSIVKHYKHYKNEM